MKTLLSDPIAFMANTSSSPRELGRKIREYEARCYMEKLRRKQMPFIRKLIVNLLWPLA